MEDLIPSRFRRFLGAQQQFARIGGYRLVGFNAPEAGILVPQVPEAGDQQPFERGSAPGKILAAGVPGFQAGGFFLQGDALHQERLERFGYNAGNAVVDANAQGGNQVFGGRVVNNGLGRDVEIDHDARVERDKIDLGDISVHAYHWLVHHAALVCKEEFGGRLDHFCLLFLPGHQDAFPQGGQDFDGGDAGAR